MAGPYFEEYSEDWSYTSQSKVITESDLQAFVELCGFNTPTFTDKAYFESNKDYAGRIVPGLFVLSLAEGLVMSEGLTRRRGIFLMELHPQFKKPAYVGDQIRNRVRLHSKRLTSKPDRGVVVTAHEVLNQNDDVLVTYTSTRMIRTREFVETA